MLSPYLCPYHLATQRCRHSSPQWVYPTKSHQWSLSGRLEDSLSPSPCFRAGSVSLGSWLVPFISISWYQPFITHLTSSHFIFSPQKGEVLLPAAPKRRLRTFCQIPAQRRWRCRVTNAEDVGSWRVANTPWAPPPPGQSCSSLKCFRSFLTWKSVPCFPVPLQFCCWVKAGLHNPIYRLAVIVWRWRAFRGSSVCEEQQNTSSWNYQ